MTVGLRGDAAPGATTSEGWTQRVGRYSDLPGLIRHLGARPEALLAAAGLAADALDDPDGRIPYAAICRLLQLAPDATGCRHFGLLAGRMWQLSDLGIVGELVRNSSTVREALDTLAVYQQLNSGGGMVFVLERDGFVDLGYAVYHPGVFEVEQVYDVHLASGMNIMRELCGNDWLPTDVFVPRARAEVARHYLNLFKVAPQFDAELASLRFPVRLLDEPVGGADAGRLAAARARLRAVRKPRFSEQVHGAVRRLLLDERYSGDDLAQMLAMHRRTLNRRLRSEGTTFQQVLDQVRFDVARSLLAFSDISLDDVAATLGYAGVSPFMRTFRRWSGTTPTKWRRGHRAARCVAAAEVAAPALPGARLVEKMA